jgi:hypothetical protein
MYNELYKCTEFWSPNKSLPDILREAADFIETFAGSVDDADKVKGIIFETDVYQGYIVHRIKVLTEAKGK